MTKSKFYLITLLTAILLSVVLGSSSVFASDISSISQTEATISVPLTQWNELKSNNEKALNELDKVKADLVKKEVTLSEMSSSIDELKNKIENDKKTIKRLRMQRNLSQILGAGATIGIAIRG